MDRCRWPHLCRRLAPPLPPPPMCSAGMGRAASGTRKAGRRRRAGKNSRQAKSGGYLTDTLKIIL